MQIREATPADIDGILRLACQIGDDHYVHAPEVFMPPSEKDRDFWLNLVKDEQQLFSVAVTEQQAIAGLITARITINETIPFINSHPVCRIGTIVVDENHRQQGIGHQLMKHCEGWAREVGAVQMRLEVMSFNQPAKSFYAETGFQLQSEILAKALD